VTRCAGGRLRILQLGSGLARIEEAVLREEKAALREYGGRPSGNGRAEVEGARAGEA
jgi:hypothetical protein